MKFLPNNEFSVIDFPLLVQSLICTEWKTFDFAVTK